MGRTFTLRRRKAKSLKPGADATPVAKISYVTKVDDLGCGVGYYK
jgi:hypothetical protein